MHYKHIFKKMSIHISCINNMKPISTARKPKLDAANSSKIIFCVLSILIAEFQIYEFPGGRSPFLPNTAENIMVSLTTISKKKVASQDSVTCLGRNTMICATFSAAGWRISWNTFQVRMTSCCKISRPLQTSAAGD